MRRRELIVGLAGTAAWPVVAPAQRAPVPVIGYLATDRRSDLLSGFRQGLSENGYFEGGSVTIEYRFADGKYDRLPALAADLVRREVTVIAAQSTPCVLAAKAATQTIPIVFSAGVDPVQTGLVASLARPGGNITGLSTLINEVVAKRLELLREMVPETALIAMITNRANTVPSAAEQAEAQHAARILGVRLLVMSAGVASEIEAAFAETVRQHAGAILIGVDALYITQRDQIVALAARNRIPAMFPERGAVEAGGLMSYDSSRFEASRQLAIYASRVLKGERPADLPVQQVVKIELVLNRKTARALGLAVPESILLRADEVIE
jgi:putative tryptophan/tyrosine transport system substrate-binding protein